jgi:hypothetical protein
MLTTLNVVGGYGSQRGDKMRTEVVQLCSGEKGWAVHYRGKIRHMVVIFVPSGIKERFENAFREYYDDYEFTYADKLFRNSELEMIDTFKLPMARWDIFGARGKSGIYTKVLEGTIFIISADESYLICDGQSLGTVTLDEIRKHFSFVRFGKTYILEVEV